MKDADDEIAQLEKELEMQRIVNEGLNKEKKSNQNKINNLTQQFHKYKDELSQMQNSHTKKLEEMHQVR